MEKNIVNNYGYFQKDGSEFVVITPNTPRNWYNYMFNNDYVTFTSQVGFGQSCTQDDLGRRVWLVENRNVFLIDTTDNSHWMANGLPISKKYDNFECIHGMGYSDIRLNYGGIATSYNIYVPKDGIEEIWTVKVKNNRQSAATLKVIPYFKTNLDGQYAPQGYNTATGGFDANLNAVIGRSFCDMFDGQRKEAFGYLTTDQSISGFDSRKNAFVGTYGEEQTPAAILENHGCTDSECLGEKLCFALECTITLQPGEEKTLDFVAGITYHKNDIAARRAKYFENNGVQRELNAVVALRRTEMSGVNIKTQDENLNYFYNNWVKYQTNMGSRWARVRHNGYRDLTSDCECLGSFNPHLAWERLKRVLGYQYSNGYAPRTFMDGRIKDNNFSDNTVWMTFAVHDILKEIGDLSILDDVVPFNDGSEGTVYEHIKRSTAFLFDFTGHHGLCRIWGGDWNDCMNFVGTEGKGVSVWLSIAWYRANRMFGEIAAMCGKQDDVKLAEKRGKIMQQRIDQYGWDGEYYLYARNDQDEPIGSHTDDEGSIFLNPQLWAVLSGVSLDGKEVIAMDAADRLLERPLGTLVSYPGYTKIDGRIGWMSEKPPGVHENAGVYLHASCWKLAADAMLKRNDKVQEGIEKILPFCHKYVQKHCEPYILPNSYFAEETGYRYATAGQSWRTAANQWFGKALVMFVFGIQPELEGLKLNPCLPPSWRECSIKKEFRGAKYNITYKQISQGACNTISKIMIDGAVFEGEFLPFENGRTFDVVVELS